MASNSKSNDFFYYPDQAVIKQAASRIMKRSIGSRSRNGGEPGDQ
jgi:hypothetical protein